MKIYVYCSRIDSLQLTQETRSGPGIAIDNLSHIRPEKAILSFKAFFIDLFKCFKMVFNTPIIRGILRIARPVDRRNVGHGLLPFFIALFKIVIMVVKQPP